MLATQDTCFAKVVLGLLYGLLLILKNYEANPLEGKLRECESQQVLVLIKAS